MAENNAIIGTLLTTENKQEAEDVMDIRKTLTTEQVEKLEVLLRGVKIGYNLALSNAVKTA